MPRGCRSQSISLSISSTWILRCRRTSITITDGPFAPIATIIAYWAWELPEFPDSWVDRHRFFDEIWCPSEFTRAAIAAKLPKPVLAMPHAIDFPVPQGDFERNSACRRGRFLFLFCLRPELDPGAQESPRGDRGIPQGLSHRRSGRLVVKTHNPDRHSTAFADSSSELEGLPDTYLICETLPRTAVYELQQACDCFVSLHRGRRVRPHRRRSHVSGKAGHHNRLVRHG